MFRKKKPEPELNLLEMVPLQAVDSEVDEESGLATVMRPKFMSGALSFVLQPRLRKPHYKVHLDEMGTRVWELIDGEHTVGEILDALREELGENEDDLDRLCLFLSQLEGGKMIRYQELEEQ